MMESLDPHYLAIIRAGLVAIRNAARDGDWEYCRVESEHIHELPSLIGESNRLRHLYYIAEHRQQYIGWLSAAPRSESQLLAVKRYLKPWAEIEGVLGIEKTGITSTTV